jgi:hypothetical protein
LGRATQRSNPPFDAASPNRGYRAKCRPARIRDKRPDFIHECNCTLCRKAGARWGYFEPPEVSVEGEAEGYCREGKDDPSAQIQFCGRCGSTTHFVLTESAVAKHGNVVMGVNMRLAEESDLAGIELRYPDGKSWSGQGAFGYVREVRIIGG